MKHLTLCADDFGLAPGIDAGICALAEGGRLSAVSCMMSGRSIQESAGKLLEFSNTIDIGLHLTLTDHCPLTAANTLTREGHFFGQGALWRKALTGSLDLGDVEREISGQLDAFEKTFSSLPNFLDGHHHVHQIPSIREVVVRVVAERYADKDFYIRTTAEEPLAVVKRGVSVAKALTMTLLGRSQELLAHEFGIRTNNGFSGVYDFSNKVPYRDLFKRFVSGGRDRMLIMCHPGYSDDLLKTLDSVIEQREIELAYFNGDEFLGDLDQAGFRLARFRSDFQRSSIKAEKPGRELNT
jgi:chitin disaccharide deacetylase